MKSKYSNGLFSNRRSSTGPPSARTFEQAARSVRMRARGKVFFCSRGVRPSIFFGHIHRRKRKDQFIIASTMSGSNGWTTVTKNLRRSRKDGPEPQAPVAVDDALAPLEVREAWPTPRQGATKTVEVDQTAEHKSADRRPSDASDESVPELLELLEEESSGDEAEPRPPSKPLQAKKPSKPILSGWK